MNDPAGTPLHGAYRHVEAQRQSLDFVEVHIHTWRLRKSAICREMGIYPLTLITPAYTPRAPLSCTNMVMSPTERSPYITRSTRTLHTAVNNNNVCHPQALPITGDHRK